LGKRGSIERVRPPVPAYDSLLPPTTGTPFVPDVYVFDRHFQNPRTII